MRLLPNEISAIKSAILGRDESATIYLYGSRLQDNLEGGDIDILVKSNKLQFKDKVDILIDIKDQIGEQKIDLSIKTPEELKNDPFFENVISTAQKI